MKPRLTIAITLATAVLSGSLLLGQTSRTAEAQFKAAQNKEQVEGDRKGAIEQYKTLAQGSDRAVAAKAQARLAALQSSSPAAQVGQTVRLLSTDLVGRTSDETDVGTPSADGRYLSYSTSNGVAVLDLKSGSILSLKNLGDAAYYAENSVVSPDGRQVAYVWDMTPLGHDVRVAPVTRGNAARSRSVHLNHGNGDINNGHVDVLGWSPDGKSVLADRELRDRRDLAVISIANGSVRVLRDSLIFSEASFSPDGRYVAYAARSRGAATSDIFIVTADGSESRVVVEAPGEDRNPMWSPDGSHIVFLTNRTGNLSLWMVPVAGGRTTGPARLVKANVAPFSPLGITRTGALYYLAGDAASNVYTSELDGKLTGAAPSMATNQYINSNRGGAWSPDGQSLAYIVSTPRGAVVRVRSVKTGEDREVPTAIPSIGSVKWFPDGRSMLLVSRDARLLSGNLGFYRVTVASGQAELLHQTAARDVVSTRPDISPDGRTILYLESPVQPVRFDIDSRRETRLTPLGELTQEPRRALSLAVSPDAAQIAYVGAQSLMVTPAAGGEPRELVRFSGESSPRERAEGMGLTWSPDGRFLFFVRPDARGIWRVPLAGGPAEDIGVSMGRIRALRMHPDGRRITFDSVIDAPSEVWALENFLPKPTASK